MDVYKNQVEIHQEISKIKTNFKKDTSSRKTVDYYKTRITKLDSLWEDFKYNHDRMCTEESRSHQYFSEMWFEKTQESYTEVRDLLWQNYQEILEPLFKSEGGATARQASTSTAEGEQGRQPEDSDYTNKNQQGSSGQQQFFTSTGTNSKYDELLRKQQVNIKALSRTMEYIDVEEISEKWEFEDALKSLQTRWDAVDKLHWEMDAFSVPDTKYASMFCKFEKRYIELKRSLNKKMWSVSHREKSTPKIDIPTFSGNYNQWMSFKDLFDEAIHNNPSLSNAQKMQFLRGKLRGEAERLIQHLPISTTNYEVCWDILKNRYHNKKLIFTSHITLLLGMPSMSTLSASQIKKLHDVTQECLNAIKNLGVDISTWDPLLVHLLSQKLDTETFTDYVESLKNSRELPLLKDFLQYLESKFIALESASRKQDTGAAKIRYQSENQQASYSNKKRYQSNNQESTSGTKNYQKSYHFKQSMPTYQGRQQYKSDKPTCPICSKNHGIFYCQQFLEMSNVAKCKAIAQLSICKNCLYSHNGKDCISNKRCRTCQGDHNTILHEAYTTKSKHEDGKKYEQSRSGECAGNAHVARKPDSCEVLLATALIKVQAVDGTYQTMRALIDQGSQTSIITERGAQLLRLPRQKCKGVITGVGEKISQCKGLLTLNCISMDENYAFSTDVYIMSNLVKKLPSNTLCKPSWEFLSSIKLADPEFHISRSVDILLGAEIYSNIIQGGICRSEQAPILAQQTRLGWILCGAVTSSLQCNVIMNNIEQIERFWQIEDISEESNFTSEDQHCIDFFKKTTRRKEDGMYVVQLPLKSGFENQLGNSRSKAVAQFLHLEQKLMKQPNISQQYNAFIDEYIALGHMKPSIESAKITCYLPHHCVIRNESTTTSLRVVFNASAPTSSKVSLNDVMMRGPNLQKDLMSLVLKWRQYKIAFTADIEKMFRNIWLAENDQNLHKIIWRNNPYHPLQEYQLTTVTYGTKAAPFLAMMTLKQLAQDEQVNYPEAARVVENSFYMDDLLHGLHSCETAQKLKKDLIALLKAGGFNLRKWSSNAPELLQSEQTHQENFEFKTDQNQKTLGLRWNPTEDIFTFQVKIGNTESTKTTKRALLSEISKLFDPLGWLSPFTIKLKLLFQEVWQRDILWDDELPQDLQSEWSKIKSDIHHINNIKISRWIYTEPTNKVELHAFCDASMKAYACAIYSKTSSNEQSRINLVVAKTRLVSNNKKVTLPRLELCGAHLASTLMNRVLQCLTGYHIKIFGWCDSTAVLGWIQGGPDKWKPFVAKRVAEISNIIPPSNWRYVKSGDNPTDCASRGITAPQLQSHSLWWQGPSWLSTPSFEEVQAPPIYETNEEKRLQKHAYTTKTEESIIEYLLNKYSDFRKLIRVLSWVRRVLIPKHDRKSFLTLGEIKQATIIICKHVQQQEFGDEINKLCEKKNISSKSKILSLNPFLENNGLLRVGGRLRNANIHPEMKNPIILPHNSRLTDLIIDNAHELTFHGGTRLTLSFLRQRYWIVGGVQAVKKRLRSCVTCRKHNPNINHQIMGDLPSPRTNPSRPFYHSGVDFTGHVEVKANKGRGIKTTKGYIAVFVCMATKAVHLELVSDMSSSSFLAALRRMASRRGTPRHVYCDNGTNFVGSSNILQQELINLQAIIDERFHKEITEMEIQFHFNAPAWPSAGGLWEAAVKSMKRHLKAALNGQKFTFEELSTLLSQIEACLNSRPLCPLTEDPDDFNYLTPSHFLASGPILTIIETEKDQRTRWEYTQRILQEIWNRWSTEYLTQLSQRSKWKQARDNIKINDLAMIHDANLPPGKWAMGRVVELHPGNDGQVRVVTLKTKNGYIKRPVIKLSILPIKTSHNTMNNDSKTQPKLHLPSQQSTLAKQSAALQETIKKSNKFTFSSVCLMLLYFMSILSPSKAAFNITPLQKNQSLYLDPVSTMHLIRDKWTLVVYYDMSPYWEGTKAYEKLTEQLNSTCLKIENNNCNMIISQLMHEYNELRYYNNILLSQQFSGHSPYARRRRGLINGIGYLANSLFGVLDERFAEQYSKDITQLKQNQAHVANLWRNQTSVIEAESNLLQRTTEIMQKHHKHIHKQLISLTESNKVLQGEVNRLATMEDFMLSSLSASNLVHNLRATQENLIDAITDIYHGELQLHLLTPEQLIHELNIISGQVSSEVSLPIGDIQKDVRKIYKLLKVKARVTKQYLLFEVIFPLVSRDKFKLYHAIPVPQQKDKYMVTVIPVADYISINIEKDTYVTMTHDELLLCTIHDGSYMCPQQKPVYHLTNNNNLCEKDLETKQYKFRRGVCTNKWEPLSTPLQFLYFCCDVYTVKIICGENISLQQLSMGGILSLSPNCVIKGNDFSIAPHKTYQNQLNISSYVFIPQIDHINHVINISLPEPDINDTDSKELSSIIGQLKQQIKEIKASSSQVDYQISTHDIHQYAGITLLLASALVIGGIFLWKQRYCQRRRRKVIISDIELQSMADSGPGRTSTNNSQRTLREGYRGENKPLPTLSSNRVDKACSPINIKRIDLHL